MDEVILLHGGKDWNLNDTVDVTLSGYNYRIKVTAVETTRYKADVGGSASAGLCRPEPTPFDSDTAVTASAILGSLYTPLNGISNISAEVIGNGIYLSSASVAFNVQIVENDLMKVIT